MKVEKKIFLCLFLLFSSGNAFSWGKTGHRIVAEIAERHLDTIAKKEIKKLLGTDDLSRSSTWADEIRSEEKFNYMIPWHYVSIPNGKKYLDQKRNKEGDLIETLFRLEESLRDVKTSETKKVEALKFIIHGLGDLHQPLHVGLPEDRGGNSIKLKWFKNETNLHVVWDENLIAFEELSYLEYANYLDHFSEEEKKDYENGNFLDWAEESLSLRKEVYNTGEKENIGYEYHHRVKPIMELRLKKAGLRLAFVLNNIFNKSKLKKDYLDLREKIKNNI